MTTLVVVKKEHQIVIAGDSLTTFGDMRLPAEYDRSYDKIVQYQDTYIALCGSAAHQLVFHNLLAHQKKSLNFSNKALIFETFRQLHPILKEKHFLNPKEDEDDPYESSQLSALVANPHGIFGVYSMREVFEFERFWAAGSGREFALGAMHAVYSTPSFDAQAIADAGIAAGTMFDRNSALPMTRYTISLSKDNEDISTPAENEPIATKMSAKGSRKKSSKVTS
ncbi:MAG: MFS transporter [Pseudomonadota bacterium]